jgi:hypothetical protein
LLKKELALPPTFEFHFHDNHPNIRKAFLKAISPYSFFYFAIVINKNKLYGEGFQYKESFYKNTSSLVFENAKPYLRNAKVVIDKCGSKTFRGQLAKYLKRKINEDISNLLIKRVKMEDSHKNNLLQLADMITGAIFRSYRTEKQDSKEYRKIIKHREMFVQFWPR